MREIEKREEKCKGCQGEEYCWGGEKLEALENLVEAVAKAFEKTPEISPIDERVLEMHRQLFEKSMMYRWVVLQLVVCVAVTVGSRGLSTALMEMVWKLREMIQGVARTETVLEFAKGEKEWPQL